MPSVVKQYPDSSSKPLKHSILLMGTPAETRRYFNTIYLYILRKCFHTAIIIPNHSISYFLFSTFLSLQLHFSLFMPRYYMIAKQPSCLLLADIKLHKKQKQQEAFAKTFLIFLIFSFPRSVFGNFSPKISKFVLHYKLI